MSRFITYVIGLPATDSYNYTHAYTLRGRFPSYVPTLSQESVRRCRAAATASLIDDEYIYYFPQIEAINYDK